MSDYPWQKPAPTLSSSGSIEPVPNGSEFLDGRVGGRVQQRRLELGMTVESFAAATGIAPTLVEMYERGEVRITPSRLIEFAKALSADISYFFEDLN